MSALLLRLLLLHALLRSQSAAAAGERLQLQLQGGKEEEGGGRLARQVLFGRGLFNSSAAAGTCLPVLPKPKVIVGGGKGRRRQLGGAPDRAHVFFFNDWHGRLTQRLNEDGSGEYGGVSMAETIQELRHQYGTEQSILVSVGDNIGATEYICASLDEQPMIDVLNVLDTRVVALGNHEFDRGAEWLQNKLTNTSIPHLAANIYRDDLNDTATNAYQTSYIWSAPNGRKVGFVGVVTQSVPLLVRSSGISGLRFDNMVQAANREAEYLINDQQCCDALILLAHQGGHPTGDDSEEWIELLNNIHPRYNAILSGHTHITYQRHTPTVLAMQAGCYGSHLGHLVIDWGAADDAAAAAADTVDGWKAPFPSPPATKSPRVEGYLIDASRPNPNKDPFIADPVVIAVRDIVARAVSDAEDGRRRIIGRTCRPISRAADASGDILRSEESQLVHLIADAMRSNETTTADIAIVNPGNVRGCLPSGVITADIVQSALPFQNTMVLMEMSGNQILSLLRQQFQTPRLMLGVSNMRYTYVNNDIIDVWIGDDGQPLDLDRYYTVLTNDFLADGGDGFEAFKSARLLKHYETLTDYQVTESYLERHTIVEAECFERAIDLSQVDPHALDVQLCIRSWSSAVIDVGMTLRTTRQRRRLNKIGNLRMGLILNVKGEDVFAFSLFLPFDMYTRGRSKTTSLSLEVPNTYPEDSIQRMDLWIFSDTFDYNPFPNGIQVTITTPFPNCSDGHG